MDRFEYSDARLVQGEEFLMRENGVKLYDGDSKTTFEGGELVVSSTRILWGRPGDIPRGQMCICLPLFYIVLVEEEQRTFSFSSSRKFVLHLSEPRQGKPQGPVTWSQHSFIKISFKEGLHNDFLGLIQNALMTRAWERLSLTSPSSTASIQNMADRKWRSGIVGIERKIEEKHKATDESISLAFQDLSRLMNMAKDMVAISRSISTKIREKQGDITEDETVRFKSYLLSLGIDDPVTRGAFSNQTEYFQSLARQLAQMLEEPIKEVGGMMSMADVYCRVNRARGLELLSPEDLMSACRLMSTLQLGLCLRTFDSGATVLQLSNHNDSMIVENTAVALEENGSLSATELAKILGISVLLAKERLLTTEKQGRACRDESLEGIRFYSNLFLTKEE
ncbi:Vacuolar protein-sorting-associated protein 36 [Frankliniella fusca]|uniref:Vacuolar protein-sorting-associated protein 36 n=1 Tax=Frankliniella fusca TaxID=407009 RepID=A0AAE1HPA3_9NEOP|nr:Vacuolar protein-sorting-associated protein 36 [Frankliniella fusca]